MLIPFTSASFTNLSGLAVADGAEVEVRLESNGALAALFDDRDGTTPLTNPFNADSQGRFAFYVAGVLDGYSVEVTKGAQTHILHHQLTSSAAATSFTQLGSGAVSRAIAERLWDTSSAKDYGITGAKINEWLAYIASVGGTHFWPFGDYSTSTQLVLNAGSKTLEIFCAGAVITTTGAISGFKISGKSDPHSITIHDLIVDHRGNTTATFGFEQVNTSYVRWPGCKVLASSAVGASYAAWYLHQSNVNDTGTGCFWTDFGSAQVYSSVGRLPTGVLLEGACNATNFHWMSIANCNDAIKIISNVGGVVYLSSGVVITGARFEGFTNAVRVIGSSGQQTAEGLVIAHNRFEDAGSDSFVLSLEGATVSAYRAPFIGYNELVADTGTAHVIVNNPENLRVNKLEHRETAVTRDVLYFGSGFTVASLGAADDAFIVEAANADSGQLWRNQGFNIASLRYISSGGIAEFKGSAADGVDLALCDIAGISRTTTRSKNLAGTATFAGAATVAVTFPLAEADNAYLIALGPQANETFWYTNETTTGFTLHSSNSSSNASVTWFLIR